MLADINNIFNGLNSEDVGFKPRRQEPDAPVETVIPENVAPDTETDTNILDAELEATNAETAIRLDVEPADNVISFEAAEAEAFAILTAAFDEEGEFAPFEHHDAEAFDAMATSEAGKRYKLYLDNKDSNSVLTQGDTRNSNESFTRQMSRQMFADAMYSNLERIQEIDNQLDALNGQLDGLQLDLAEIDQILQELREQIEEARDELERVEAEREQEVTRADELRRDQEDAQEDVDEAERDVAEAEANVVDAEENGSPIEQVRAEQELLRRQAALEAAKERLDGIATDLTASIARIAEYDTQIEEQERILADLQAREATTLEERLEKLDEIRAVQENIQTLQTEKVTLVQENSQFVQSELALQQEDPEAYNQGFMAWVSNQASAGLDWAGDLLNRFTESESTSDTFVPGVLQQYENVFTTSLTAEQNYLNEINRDISETQSEYAEIQELIKQQEAVVAIAETELEEDEVAADRALREVMTSTSPESVEAYEVARAEADQSRRALEEANARLDELNAQEAEIQAELESLQEQLADLEASGSSTNDLNATILATQISRDDILAKKETVLDENISDMEAHPDLYSDSIMQSRYSLRSDLAEERTQIATEIARLEQELAEAQTEYDQALSDSAYDLIGSEDLASMGFEELNSNALTVYDESGAMQFKIMASYDENGEMTGYMASDSRLMLELRATQHAVPLDQFSAEDQATIMAAINEAGGIEMVDGNAFNAALDQSRAASAAVARNAQFEAATPGLQMNRLEATEAHLESVQQELAIATGTVTSAAAADGAGIQTETNLTTTFAHADIPRDEPLDNPTPSTQDYTSDGTLSPVAGAESHQLAV